MSSNQEVMVTVLCLTYNHMAYIKQCLDGFLMQDTSFKFEVIVHDDASTDGTTEILKEYVLKYPDIIRPIIETENQYTKVGFSGMFLQMSRKSNGKYIALCEGDDYWTDPYKLQKQVDFLESHPDYVMCSHKYQIYEQESNEYVNILPEIENEKGDDFFLTDLIVGKWLVQPLCMMCRKSALEDKRLERYKYMIDTVFIYNLLTQGKAFCLSDTMGVYRVQNRGIWSGKSLNEKIFMQLKAVKSICDIEKTDVAARFLLFQFSKPISRIWLLRNVKRIIPMVNTLADFYGYAFVFKMLFRKMFFNQNVQC